MHSSVRARVRPGRGAGLCHGLCPDTAVLAAQPARAPCLLGLSCLAAPLAWQGPC